MFGIEGLEDALGRLQERLPRMSLTWTAENRRWTVILQDNKGNVCKGTSPDLLEAYDNAWQEVLKHGKAL